MSSGGQRGRGSLVFVLRGKDHLPLLHLAVPRNKPIRTHAVPVSVLQTCARLNSDHVLILLWLRLTGRLLASVSFVHDKHLNKSHIHEEDASVRICPLLIYDGKLHLLDLWQRLSPPAISLKNAVAWRVRFV